MNDYDSGVKTGLLMAAGEAEIKWGHLHPGTAAREAVDWLASRLKRMAYAHDERDGGDDIQPTNEHLIATHEATLLRFGERIERLESAGQTSTHELYPSDSIPQLAKFRCKKCREYISECDAHQICRGKF